jgi:hypothetical protein
MYRKAAQAVSELNFRSTDNFYPPLFPWLGTPFVRWIPNHTYFIPSFLCLIVHLFGIAYIGDRWFGKLATIGTLAFLLLAFPKIWLEQWVIPWTSSGVGALSSILFLLYFRFEHRNKWYVDNYKDWLAYAGFFLAYGAIFATRPLDVFPFLPLVAFFGFRMLLNTHSPGHAIALSCATLLSGLVFPAMYLLLNYHAFGKPFGGYIGVAGGVGFIVGPQLLERAVSLWIDSAGIYGESVHSIGGYFPVFIPALLLCAASIAGGPLFTRLVALAVVVQFTIYVAFADLTPENMFPNNVVHYFKWAIPWLLLIALGKLMAWIAERRWVPILIWCGLSVCLMSIHISIIPIATKDQGDEAAGSISLDLEQPTSIDIIDAVGIDGGFGPFGESNHSVNVDGYPLKGFTSVRALRLPWGTRFFFPRGVEGKSIKITFAQPFAVRSDHAVSVGFYRFSIFGFGV